MKTVNQILLQRRTQLGLSLSDVEKETKIRQKYLSAIETGHWSEISSDIPIGGFIRSYADFLGLPPEKVMAVFRRDFELEKRNQFVPEGLSTDSNRGFHWTPKATLILFICLLLTVGTFFGVKQYLLISGAPPLETYTPADGQTIKGAVLISGKTDRDTSVNIDNIPVMVLPDGSFKEEAVLPKGENIILIEAINRQGKKRVVNLKVIVE